MRLAILATTALLATTSYALGGGGATVPEKAEGVPPSGRPTAVLNQADCERIWKNSKDTLSGHIINFEMVDKSGDGKVSKSEFKRGCEKGWVQKHASLPSNSGGGQTPRDPMQ